MLIQFLMSNILGACLASSHIEITTHPKNVEIKDPKCFDSTLLQNLKSSQRALVLVQDFLRNIKASPKEYGVSLDSASIRKKATGDWKHCQEINASSPESPSGVYQIWPTYLNHPLHVYCEMTEEGGWTVFQRRMEQPSGQENFQRSWVEYKYGFGNVEKEYWLGNDALFALTNERPVTLRIDLEDFEGNKRYAIYKNFVVGSEIDKYKLYAGEYHGDAGDDLRPQLGSEFQTYDNVRVMSSELAGKNCVEAFKGGWWYYAGGCHNSNLNGLYFKGKHTSYADGVNWKNFKGYNYSLKNVEMKISPM